MVKWSEKLFLFWETRVGENMTLTLVFSNVHTSHRCEVGSYKSCIQANIQLLVFMA